jgi:hypothetical protein
MKFEQAMKAMRKGKKVRRKRWGKGHFIRIPEDESGENNSGKPSWFKDETGDDIRQLDCAQLLTEDWVVLKQKRTDEDVWTNPKVGDAVWLPGELDSVKIVHHVSDVKGKEYVVTERDINGSHIWLTSWKGLIHRKYVVYHKEP